MPASKFLTVNNTGSAIVFTYTDQPDGSGNVLSTQSISKANIGTVDSLFYIKPPLSYPIGTWQNPDDRTQPSQIQTLVMLKGSNGVTIKTFDCDNAINQAGWQGKTNTALNQAVTDITSWL